MNYLKNVYTEAPLKGQSTSSTILWECNYLYRETPYVLRSAIETLKYTLLRMTPYGVIGRERGTRVMTPYGVIGRERVKAEVSQFQGYV